MHPLVMPIIVPLVTAVGCLLARRRMRLQEAISTLGIVAFVAVAFLLLARVLRGGILATQVGGWPAPFGISLVGDVFSALMVAVTAVVGIAVVVYSRAQVDPARRRYGYHPLVHVLLAGVSGAFLTGDLFNLYVWFEVMLISSFALLALGGERPQLEGAFKYVVLNLLSSAFFLAGVGILYGMSGTLNLAHLSVRLSATQAPGMLDATALLFLIAFGIKAGVFPLFFWLPAAYPTPPAAVSALFAGLLTKVGVYALIRMFTLLFVGERLHRIVLVIAALTMVSGVLGAVAQRELRRILSFHIVSQIGYMLVGLGLFAPLALTSSVFYVIHHIIVKTNLFLVSGMVQRLGGTYELGPLGDLFRRRPIVAVLFLIPALSLAGTPPLSGFFAKLLVVKASLEQREYAVAIAALGVGLLTLFSMSKIWNEAFWKPRPPALGAPPDRRLAPSMLAPSVTLAALTCLLGFVPPLLFDWSAQAARQLLEPSQYVRAVLGGGG